MKAIVIYSGGLDSTVLLYYAVKMYGKENVGAISFDYGSKHNNKELDCAIWNCKKLDIPHILFHLQSIGENFKSTLLEGGDRIPYGHYAEENMKRTVVPQRNGIMMLIGAGYAESVGASQVLIGSHAGDHFVYLDCRPEYNRTINMLVEYGSGNKVSIKAPFNKLMKWDIVKRGKELKVDFSRTWSCYEGKSVPCGKCGTCTEREEAFRKAGVEDPLVGGH